MDLHRFCKELGFDQAAEAALYPHWEELQSRTSDGLPFFLKREFHAECLPVCRLAEEQDILDRIEEVARTAASNPVCARYAAMLHHAYYRASPPISLDSLPPPERHFGENAGVFQLLVAMSSIPSIARRHKDMGLPEHMTADAASWFRGAVDIYKAAHRGIPGFTLHQASWPRLAMDGRLFRLGRLEYLLGNWTAEKPAVLRNRSDHSLRVLCGDRWRFNRNGDRLQSTAAPEETAFLSRLKTTSGQICGTPILPDGTIRTDRPETLSLREWEPVFTPWDLIPSIHIPGGAGSLDLTALKDSMVAAQDFFRRRFDAEVKAFVCNSWIFNPAWQRELPGSHISAWQRNVYLLPPLELKDCGLFFVYGCDKGDPRDMQRTTSLHEAFCRIYERGECLKYGGMFYLADDLADFGTEFYRRKSPGRLR